MVCESIDYFLNNKYKRSCLVCWPSALKRRPSAIVCWLPPGSNPVLAIYFFFENFFLFITFLPRAV